MACTIHKWDEEAGQFLPEKAGYFTYTGKVRCEDKNCNKIFHFPSRVIFAAATGAGLPALVNAFLEAVNLANEFEKKK